MSEVTILGAGGFGTALAVMCAKNGDHVVLWSPFSEQLERIREDRENKRLLPGVPVPGEIVLTDSLERLGESDLVMIATPSHAVEETSLRIAPYIGSKPVLASVAKGFHPQGLCRLSEVIERTVPGHVPVILSGPSHAEEVARGEITTVVAASKCRSSAERVQEMLTTNTFRIYVNDDVVGVELGGALKNVISICAGMCTGLGFGDNARSALMTRGITEIARLGVAMGAKSETFAGLAGIGDLIVTCTSEHSRNRRAGILIGKGSSPEDAVKTVGTVEGYAAAKIAHDLSVRYGIDMPIVQQTYEVLFENKPIRDAVEALMARPRRHESEKVWIEEKK